MKSEIHPNYNKKAVILCNSCKTEHVVGSTLESASVEVCSNCHPFYTGKQNVMLDADDRISKFKKQIELSDQDKVVKKRKKVASRATKTTQLQAGPKVTLHDMLKQLGK